MSIDPPIPQASCPCASGEDFADCCAPLLARVRAAPTALALMRSRYTAHVTHNTDYLWDTWEKHARRGADREAIVAWAHNHQWLGLTILDTVAGNATDNAGIVEFIARFSAIDDASGTVLEHRERSRFTRFGSGWRYVDDVSET